MILINNFTTDNLIENIRNTLASISTNFTIEIALYIITGFLFGFIFKYTSKYLISLFIILTLSLWGLEYIEIIKINYCYMKEILGLSADSQPADLINYATAWTQSHIPQCLSSGLGFYLAIELL